MPIFKKVARSECGNHRGISLTPVVMRVLAAQILLRLKAARGKGRQDSGQVEAASIKPTHCVR